MKKQIALIIVVSLFFSNLTYLLDVEAGTDKFFQPDFYQAFSKLQSPFMFLDSASKEDTPLFPEFKPTAKKDTGNKNQQDTGIFLNANYKRTLTVSRNNKSAEKSYYAVYICRESNSCVSPPGPELNDPGLTHSFSLSFLVLLARSNLPWEITGSFAENCPITA